MISNVEQRTDISGAAQSSFNVWSRHQLGTCTALFEKKKTKLTKGWFTQSWCLLIKSTIASCCSCCRCRGGQDNNNNNFYWPLILTKLPFLLKEKENVGLFRELNSKLQNGSHQLLYISFFSLLPAGEVYFGPVMSSQPPRKPRVELIFSQWSTGFWILFFEFHKNCWIRFSTWESFIGFHLWGSPISTSLACLLSITLEIKFRGKRGVATRTMGRWDVISCLLLSCVLYCIEGEFEQIITKERQQQLTAE